MQFFAPPVRGLDIIVKRFSLSSLLPTASESLSAEILQCVEIPKGQVVRIISRSHFRRKGLEISFMQPADVLSQPDVVPCKFRRRWSGSSWIGFF